MDLKFIGVKEIQTALQGMPKQLSHKLMQSAHAAAGKATVNAAKLLAPEGPTGNLVDSIGVIKTSLVKANELGEIRIGPRRGRYKGFAGHLVEFGTKKRKLKGRGKYRAGTDRGVMPAKPFMQPAWNRTSEQVKNSIAEQTGRVLVNYIKRTVKT